MGLVLEETDALQRMIEDEVQESLRNMVFVVKNDGTARIFLMHVCGESEKSDKEATTNKKNENLHHVSEPAASVAYRIENCNETANSHVLIHIDSNLDRRIFRLPCGILVVAESHDRARSNFLRQQSPWSHGNEAKLGLW